MLLHYIQKYKPTNMAIHSVIFWLAWQQPHRASNYSLKKRAPEHFVFLQYSESQVSFGRRLCMHCVIHLQLSSNASYARLYLQPWWPMPLYIIQLNNQPPWVYSIVYLFYSYKLTSILLPKVFRDQAHYGHTPLDMSLMLVSACCITVNVNK